MNCTLKTGHFAVSFDFVWYAQTHNKCSRNSSRFKVIVTDCWGCKALDTSCFCFLFRADSVEF